MYPAARPVTAALQPPYNTASFYLIPTFSETDCSALFLRVSQFWRFPYLNLSCSVRLLVLCLQLNPNLLTIIFLKTFHYAKDDAEVFPLRTAFW